MCIDVKKLAIAQIILGALVVGSLIYWMGWLSSGYHIREGIAPDGTRVRTMPLLAPNPPLYAWQIVHPMLGLAVLGCGIAQFFKSMGRRLAIAQVVLGALLIASLVWFIGWVEWDYGPNTVFREHFGEIEMKNLPGWEIRLIIWKIASFIPGLSVVGTGIVQKVKAGRHETSN